MLNDGQLLVHGGFDAKKEPLGDAHIWNSRTGLWFEFAQRGDVPSARYGASCVLEMDSVVAKATPSGRALWLFGGAAQKNQALDDLYLLSPDASGLAGEWSRIAAPHAPSKRYFAAICATPDRLFLHGGEVNIKRQLNDLFEFHIESRTWRHIVLAPTPERPLPAIRAGHLLFVTATTLVLYGGYTGEGGYDSLFDSFRIDLARIDDGWHPLTIGGALPAVGRPISAVRVAQPKPTDGEYLFVLGGFDNATRQPVGTLHRLTINADGSLDTKLGWRACKLWLAMGDDIASLGKGSKSTFPTPRYGFVWGVDTKNNAAPVFGGSGSTYLNDIQTFDLDDSEQQEQQ
jgi:hypothetical protein